jgi:type I restriction-modification system DNA methylase subunit
MKLASRTLYGVELVDSVARLCCMNMLLHGISGNGADEVPIDSGRDALSSHGRRHGVYALYRGNRLYYVGLASNLRSRLNTHLRDRHANTSAFI